ncbi:lipopolysaccharide assembly protein LapB [Legionella sp. km772]|uniref:tetratricopeptide repeat protein n=1 Tax=Legionella sp. km772 TaxID=2498111 RepID=UPI000F8F1080|nr:tetratricopeptide repeat protein [Legionella sp. km772]RUR08131.1 tetratricopeptide repeat protein [Legionella sp. km772]
MQLTLKNLSLVEAYFRQLQQYVKGVKESSFLQKIAAIKEQIKELKLELLIKKAQSYLDQNEGGKSFALIKADLYTAPNYLLYMIAAESMSIQNRAQQALEYYQSAFQHSANDKQQKTALLGIARMQFWLAQYVRAKDTFTRLLHYNLSAQEYQKALAGLVKSYAYYDRPQKAYQQIPSTLVFKAPELIIAAAQASSWAGWSDISKTILHDYQPVLEGSDLSSGLTKDWQDLIWQTDLDTWPNIISPTFFASRDTETFHKKQVTLDYRHYWSYAAQTSFGPEFIDYSQYNFYALNATGFYLSQSIQPNRHLSLIGKIEPMAYKDQTVLQHPSWNPVLWMAKGTVNPNDYIKLNLLAQKEIIETFPAFYNRISDNQYAGTLTLSPLAYLKLDGSLSRLNISDDNIRQGYFLATTLVANPDLGLSTTFIYRGFSNEFKSPDYFSPHQYKEKKILLRLGRRLGATWHYYLDGGLGRQYITPLVNSETNSSPTYQWGMGINGPLTKHLFVTFYYINTHQASAFIDSVGYAYQCGGLSFNLLT